MAKVCLFGMVVLSVLRVRIISLLHGISCGCFIGTNCLNGRMRQYHFIHLGKITAFVLSFLFLKKFKINRQENCTHTNVFVFFLSKGNSSAYSTTTHLILDVVRFVLPFF